MGMFRSQLLAGVSCALFLIVSCGPSAEQLDKGPLAGTTEGFNLLFVTLDTTRADHLGCYGHGPAKTPTIDELADNGILFERAYTGIPLTLPSHCSMMTGRYPKEHGIRDNGRKSLSGTLPTLAGLYSERGYATGAFVASFVLSSRFGVDRGFDVYDDNMGAFDPSQDLLHQQIPAKPVTDRALQWLEKNGSGPFFCWVHYFDAHDPYQPPAGFTNFEDPYDGELAYIDSQFKRIMDWLESSGKRDKTLIVIAGDHGESFGEHGHDGHTIFLYQSNLHVPFIFYAPTVLPEGRSVSDLVELVDLFPTLHELNGWPLPAGLISRSLVPALEGAALQEQPVYGENEYVTSAYGWAQQRSLTTGKWKYISSTKPELYDLESDPEETNNLVKQKPELARDLEQLLSRRYEAMVSGDAEDVEMEAEAQRAIEALGYSSSGSLTVADEFLTEGLPDPKEMLPSLDKQKEGKLLRARGDIAGAIRLFKEAAELNPKSTLILYDLGIAYLDTKQPELAAQALQQALEADARYLPALVSMGEALTAMGKPGEAKKQYEAAIALVPDSPEVHAVLANVHRSLQETEDAIEHFQEATRLKPDWAQVQIDLAMLFEQSGQLEEALRYYALAVANDARNAPLRLQYAVVLGKSGRSLEASREFQNVLAANPGDAGTICEVARFHFTQGDHRKALDVLTQGRRTAPTSTRVMSALARLWATSSDASVREPQKALNLSAEFCRQTGYNNPTLLATYAAAQASVGRFQEAMRTIDAGLEKARAMQQSPGVRELIRMLESQGASYSSQTPSSDLRF